MSTVNCGFYIAIVMAIIIYIVLNKTTFGYELKACGFNRDASKYAGINEKRSIVLSMVIAGALAGLGGGLLYSPEPAGVILNLWTCWRRKASTESRCAVEVIQSHRNNLLRHLYFLHYLGRNYLQTLILFLKLSISSLLASFTSALLLSYSETFCPRC